MAIHPLAGKPAPADVLINVDELERAYYERVPNVGNPHELVSFGTRLYLNPPSTGGLCDGVTTMPSAKWSFLFRLWARIALEIEGRRETIVALDDGLRAHGSSGHSGAEENAEVAPCRNVDCITTRGRTHYRQADQSSRQRCRDRRSESCCTQRLVRGAAFRHGRFCARSTLKAYARKNI